MKISVQKESEMYLLTISYIVQTSLVEAWDLLATDSGFARWFPQLRVEGDKLIFEMEDFRENMDLLEYRKNEKIAYRWDSATVSFTLSQLENQTLITFEERIPEDFGNEFANAQKDMTGWLVQNECIKKVLGGQEPPVRQPLQEKWKTFLELELEGL
ncbi:SRPBCC domain-containing protein [Streptococcus suis]|uniref:Activator of Hsp90 ATPase 1 family protein n=1 Tax=Streptococcus suis TaxID=1307 RepID=A0A0Z8LN09_STRSU|nr:SRPBCC domain-containing protein [Streptococcus suis]NQG65440.1 ATPase [Streptococcus suis]NQG67478.1 ATPase [Streptococcus suis]CYV68841.1 Activator of Hsp90 ATPase 1 family protein [Streptococcus suis]CYV93700.1 Activator of Hsp90 ATPase 1 family protein [Streptococcus suis]